MVRRLVITVVGKAVLHNNPKTKSVTVRMTTVTVVSTILCPKNAPVLVVQEPQLVTMESGVAAPDPNLSPRLVTEKITTVTVRLMMVCHAVVNPSVEKGRSIVKPVTGLLVMRHFPNPNFAMAKITTVTAKSMRAQSVPQVLSVAKVLVAPSVLVGSVPKVSNV
tara:strand:- start:17682 stop:18173 length:492 start_codon:yes stop_codon:yes gene_type:complete